MGAIIHEIIYDASKAPIDVELAWSTRIRYQVERAKQHPLNQRFADAERWPGYHLLYSGLRYFVRKYEPTCTSRGTSNSSGSRELELRCYDNKLKGRPDYFDSEQLVDYKTGVITDEQSAIAKESYSRQLKLYAAMVHAVKGYWVKKAVLLPVSGQSVVIDIEPEECDAEAAAAVERLNDYNNAIGNGAVKANPSITECARCSYQIICPAFWKNVNESWSDSLEVQSIEGTVTRKPFPIRSTSDFTLSISGSGTVATDDYTVRLGRTQLSSAEPLEAGMAVRISGLKKTSSGNALSGSLRTVIWRLDQIPEVDLWRFDN